MSDDSDQEISELDIEARTWNKMEATMKLLGFREGAVKGKNLALQEGFNLGYSHGFKLGEHLGMGKGIINCESELKLQTNSSSHFEKTLKELSSQPCTLCLVEKNTKTLPGEDVPLENLEDIASVQESHSNKIIQSVKLSHLEPYYDKG